MHFALLLIASVEFQQSSALTVHLICLALLMGRIVHAYGVSQEKENYRLRLIGMSLTFGAITASGLRLLGSFLIERRSTAVDREGYWLEAC